MSYRRPRDGIIVLGNVEYIEAVDAADSEASLWCPTKNHVPDSQQYDFRRKV